MSRWRRSGLASQLRACELVNAAGPLDPTEASGLGQCAHLAHHKHLVEELVRLAAVVRHPRPSAGSPRFVSAAGFRAAAAPQSSARKCQDRPLSVQAKDCNPWCRDLPRVWAVTAAQESLACRLHSWCLFAHIGMKRDRWRGGEQELVVQGHEGSLRFPNVCRIDTVGDGRCRLLSGGRSVGGRLQPEGARPRRPPGWAGAGRLALCRAAHVPRGL